MISATTIQLCSASTIVTTDKQAWKCSDKPSLANTDIRPELVSQTSDLEKKMQQFLEHLGQYILKALKICISFDQGISF